MHLSLATFAYKETPSEMKIAYLLTSTLQVCFYNVPSVNCFYINFQIGPHSNENYPVVVVIHDGMFHEGSGNDYAPDFLLNQDDVVVVSMIY